MSYKPLSSESELSNTDSELYPIKQPLIPSTNSRYISSRIGHFFTKPVPLVNPYENNPIQTIDGTIQKTGILSTSDALNGIEIDSDQDKTPVIITEVDEESTFAPTPLIEEEKPKILNLEEITRYSKIKRKQEIALKITKYTSWVAFFALMLTPFITDKFNGISEKELFSDGDALQYYDELNKPGNFVHHLYEMIPYLSNFGHLIDSDIVKILIATILFLEGLTENAIQIIVRTARGKGIDNILNEVEQIHSHRPNSKIRALIHDCQRFAPRLLKTIAPVLPLIYMCIPKNGENLNVPSGAHYPTSSWMQLDDTTSHCPDGHELGTTGCIIRMLAATALNTASDWYKKNQLFLKTCIFPILIAYTHDILRKGKDAILVKIEGVGTFIFTRKVRLLLPEDSSPPKTKESNVDQSMKIINLEKRNRQLESQIKEINSENNNLREENRRLNEQATKQTRENEELRNQLTKSQPENERLNEQIIEQTTEIENLRQKQQERERKGRATQKQIRELQQTIKTQQKTIEEQNEKLRLRKIGERDQYIDDRNLTNSLMEYLKITHDVNITTLQSNKIMQEIYATEDYRQGHPVEIGEIKDILLNNLRDVLNEKSESDQVEIIEDTSKQLHVALPGKVSQNTFKRGLFKQPTSETTEPTITETPKIADETIPEEFPETNSAGMQIT